MRTRPLLLPLLAVSALALTACDPEEPDVELMADVVVTVPGGPPAGEPPFWWIRFRCARRRRR